MAQDTTSVLRREPAPRRAARAVRRLRRRRRMSKPARRQPQRSRLEEEGARAGRITASNLSLPPTRRRRRGDGDQLGARPRRGYEQRNRPWRHRRRRLGRRGRWRDGVGSCVRPVDGRRAVSVKASASGGGSLSHGVGGGTRAAATGAWPSRAVSRQTRAPMGASALPPGLRLRRATQRTRMAKR